MVTEYKTIPKHIECLAIAPGPSLHTFLASYGPNGDNSIKNFKTVGCSRVTKYYDNLDYYCHGDKFHVPNLPKNPKTIIFARDRIREPHMRPWSIYTPDCGSTGGMAVSAACLMFDHVGLVGFDGRMNEFGEMLPREYIIHFTSSVLDYWSAQGKKLYNLMGESIYKGRLIDAF